MRWIYSVKSPITENNKVIHHGNTKKSQEKPYIRTSKQVLEKTSKLLQEGMSSQTVYDKVNSESGGTMFSTTQSKELRDTRQVYRQAAKVRVNESGTDGGTTDDELASLLAYQKVNPDFVRSISFLRKESY